MTLIGFDWVMFPSLNQSLGLGVGVGGRVEGEYSVGQVLVRYSTLEAG